MNAISFIYSIVCDFLQIKLLRTINLNIDIAYIGGDHECEKAIRHFNSSYFFTPCIWNNNRNESQYAG